MMGMIGQEGAPGLTRWTPRSPPAVAPNRAVADDDVQLEQLASDPLAAPEPVVAGHGHDQLLDLRAEMWAAAPGAGLPAPEQAPALPMPAHHRVRGDERQMLAPGGAEPASQDPQHLVPGAEPNPRSSASRPSQDGELVTQQQVLEH